MKVIVVIGVSTLDQFVTSAEVMLEGEGKANEVVKIMKEYPDDHFLVLIYAYRMIEITTHNTAEKWGSGHVFEADWLRERIKSKISGVHIKYRTKQTSDIVEIIKDSVQTINIIHTTDLNELKEPEVGEKRRLTSSSIEECNSTHTNIDEVFYIVRQYSVLHLSMIADIHKNEFYPDLAKVKMTYREYTPADKII